MDDFDDGFQIRLEYGFLEIAFPDEAPRVDVDCSQRFALVDHERATALQPDLSFEVGVNLAFEFEAFEDRTIFIVVFDLRFWVGNESLDMVFEAFEDFFVVHHDTFGVVAREIPHDSQR